MAIKKKFRELYGPNRAQESFLEDIYGNTWKYGIYTSVKNEGKGVMTISVTLLLTDENSDNDGNDEDRAD